MHSTVLSNQRVIHQRVNEGLFSYWKLGSVEDCLRSKFTVEFQEALLATPGLEKRYYGGLLIDLGHPGRVKYAVFLRKAAEAGWN